LFGLRFWGRECLVAGVSFSSTNSVVSAPGLTFCYKLAGQRWIEGKIDLSSSGTGPSIDHRAYSTLTEFILLKRKKSFSCCISLVWKFQNVVCGSKESPLMLCHLIN